LIEPAGTTSNNWPIAGVGIGVNAPSGFAGDLAWLGVNGESRYRAKANGDLQLNIGSLIVGGVGSAYSYASSNLVLKPSGESKVGINTGEFNISNLPLSWTSSTINQAVDLALVRDAANILAQRLGTAAQTSRIYNTYTSATNFERFNIRWNSNELILDAEAGSGGGTLRGIKLGSAATSLLGFYGATPVVRPAAVADATDAATAISQLNAVLARLRTLGLIAT
jgi:hypothetical protein